MTAGMRDVLLLKCKQAIEELHTELEGEKKLRQQAEMAQSDAENDAEAREGEIRELRLRLMKATGITDSSIGRFVNANR